MKFDFSEGKSIILIKELIIEKRDSRISSGMLCIYSRSKLENNAINVLYEKQQ